VTNIFS